MTRTFNHPFIGQQCIATEIGGQRKYLGIVIDYKDAFPNCWIRVKHPISQMECEYAPGNVRLIKVDTDESIQEHIKKLTHELHMMKVKYEAF